ncbi:unnamed protein product [Taenia asiatica]|uniref:DUF5658 domain-containing protein n=1 Tax=Taenia asiatica TaxID=60517 RepID=A0A0R3W9R1_TAEAS|nr:unnamed protein product [Taenia asiatica]
MADIPFTRLPCRTCATGIRKVLEQFDFRLRVCLALLVIFINLNIAMEYYRLHFPLMANLQPFCILYTIMVFCGQQIVRTHIERVSRAI